VLKMPLAASPVQPDPRPDSFMPMAGPTSPRMARLRSFWLDPRNRRKIGLAVLGGTVFFAFVLIGVWARACANDRCPAISGINGNNEDQASRIYAADGRQVGDFGMIRRTVLPLKAMSPAVPDAFLAIEDRRFYEHHGVDWVRFFGSIKNLITLHGLSQGFSTITMQLAGNLFPDEINRNIHGIRAIPRKIREIRVALALEKKFTKNQILELYLNKINLGNSAYGVEAAAQRYFGKSASVVNVAEAAMLAALPKSPVYYNPRKYQLAALKRRNLVIEAMGEAGYLTTEEAEGWKAYPLTLSARSDYQDVAEYFVEYVRQIVQAKFGSEVYTGGLRIYTTLDLDAQQAAVTALTAQLEKIEANGITGVGKFTHQSYRDYIEKKSVDDPERSNTPYLQGGAVVLEAKTGNILAMVGGRDFGDSKFNRMTQAMRQPGSSFKPIVYTTAVQAGLSLDQKFRDAPFPVQLGPNQDPWVPRNYEQSYSDSELTVRQGLWQSKNTIAVHVGQTVGPQAVVDEARKFGITTLKDDPDAVPSIFLGSAALRPIELIAGYSVFANLGTRVVPNAILRVEDKNGKNIWPEQAKPPIPVLDPTTAFTMNQALVGVVQHGTGASAVYNAGFKIPAGGKTGTTSDYHDVWFIGFTRDLVAGVWMGFDTPQPIMKNAQGAKLAAPAWREMMSEIYQRRRDPGNWAAAMDSVAVEVDKTNGLRATPFCPANLREMRMFAKGTEPKEFCPIHSPFRPGGGGGT
jgi:penicillin-binding protein 1A